MWWWQSRFGRVQRASGTFIGANHYAAYMGMIVCLAFGFLVAQKSKAQRMLSGLGGFRAAFQRAVTLFAPESAQPKIIFFLFMAVVMGVSILLSGSRGGIVSLGFGLLFAAILFTFNRRYGRYGLFVVLFCFLIAGYGLQIGIDPTLARFEQTQGLYERLAITRSILPMITDYPMLGLGWGNFKYLYPRYILDKDQVSSSGFAHNDWMEVGIELGFIGGLIILGGALIYIIRSIRLWRRRRNLHALGIGAGVLAGLISISFHSYFDFNMHIPANPLTLAALLAIGYAALHRQGHGYSESFFYRKRTFLLSRSLQAVTTTIIFIILASLFYFTWRHAAAEAACPTEWNSTLNLNWKPGLVDIDRAIARNPDNAAYHYQRALSLARQRADTAEDRQQQMDEAIKSLRQAAWLNPAKAIYWFELGRLYARSRPDFHGFVNVWLPKADACYAMAVRCAPKDAELLFYIADFWVWRSRLLPEKKAPVLRGNQERYQKDGVRIFQDLYQRYLRIKPGNWKRAFDSVWEVYPQDRVVFGIVPEDDAELKSLVLQELAKRSSGG